MSGGVLRELLATFGIEVLGGEQLQKADKQLDGLVAKVKAFGKVLAEGFAIKKVSEFIEGQIEAGAQLKVMAERLGTTASDLQAFDLAAGEAGVGADAMNTALRFLNRNLGEAIDGNAEAMKSFAELGIQVKNADGSSRAAGEVIGELADKIAATADPAKATNLAMKLLGRGGAELVPILLKGGSAFREAREQMQALGGGMSKGFVESAHEAAAANVRLQFALEGLKSTVVLAILPAVEGLVGWLTKITVGAIDFAKHTTILTTGLEFLAVVASVKTATSIGKLLSTMGYLKPTVLETIGALLEFIAPIAIIAALYLVFDDLYALMSGKKSLIGDTLDALLGLGTSQKVIEGLKGAFDALKGSLSEIGTTLGAMGQAFLEVIGFAKTAAQTIADFESGKFSKAAADIGATGPTSELGTANMFAENGDGSDTTPSGEDATSPGRGPWTAPDALLDNIFGEGGPPSPVSDLGMANMFGGDAMMAPTDQPRTINASVSPRYDQGGASPASGDAGAGAPVISQTNTTTVEVHTSSDQPDAIGKAVGQGVATSQQKANNNALNSVRRP